MKNPFGKKKRRGDKKAEREHEEKEVARKVEKSAAEIEAEKEAKKFAREEKKFLKLHAEKRKKWERLIAPVVLILSLIASYFIWIRSHS